jgi:hypothetical protein
MSVVLKENKIWNYVSYVIVAPTTYPIALDFHELNEAKAPNIILDGVKDYLIPHFIEKNIANNLCGGGPLVSCLEMKTWITLAPQQQSSIQNYFIHAPYKPELLSF